MNAFFTDITTWANTTKLDYLNLQANGVRASNLTSQASAAGTLLAADGAGAAAYTAIASIVGLSGAATSRQVLQADGSTGSDWVTRGLVATTSATTTYTILSTDELVNCSGASFTATLPAASSNSGKSFTIKHKGTSLSQVYTIARAGSDTIDGATSVVLSVAQEFITLVSDGTATWNVVNKSTSSAWVAYTPTVSAGFGTAASISFYYRKNGSNVQIRGVFTAGTVANITGSLTVPTGITLDNTLNSRHVVGNYGTNAASANITQCGPILMDTSVSTTLFYFGRSLANTGAGVELTFGANITTSSTLVSLFAELPVSGWT
jgi:hypothetical protein